MPVRQTPSLPRCPSGRQRVKRPTRIQLPRVRCDHQRAPTDARRGASLLARRSGRSSLLRSAAGRLPTLAEEGSLLARFFWLPAGVSTLAAEFSRSPTPPGCVTLATTLGQCCPASSVACTFALKPCRSAVTAAEAPDSAYRLRRRELVS